MKRRAIAAFTTASLIASGCMATEGSIETEPPAVNAYFNDEVQPSTAEPIPTSPTIGVVPLPSATVDIPQLDPPRTSG